jgi:uncharacterized membrane protein YbhN (UPF0104 family)
MPRFKMSGRARTVTTVIGALAVAAVLAVVLAGKGAEFGEALRAAPVWLLALAAGLQLVALLARTEAWHVCVRAAGATVSRRRLYRASSAGSVAVLVNSQLGVAARIAVLRRANPNDSPRVPALLAAEVPILATEAALAAVASFTLVGPLGLPWWLPLVAFAAMALLTVGLGALARTRRRGPWAGLAVLRSLEGRRRVLALILVGTAAQIARNWLLLRATGTPVSLLDSIAVLIAMVTISQFPVGPSVGAAATVLILGTHGVAAVAAAGVLLTATGTLGALCFAGWGLFDWLRGEPESRAARKRSARTAAAAVRAALGALPAQQRRIVEKAYFGGLDQAEMTRMLYLPLASTRRRLWPAPAWNGAGA